MTAPAPSPSLKTQQYQNKQRKDPRIQTMAAAQQTPKLTFGLQAYRAATTAIGPFADFVLRYRMKRGKEDGARLGERKGVASRARPDAPLLWIHAVSVGESLSVLPLIDRLSAKRPELQFLVTTGTITSAELMEQRLPEGAFHQFAPVDRPSYVERFLNHWRPDGAIFLESEFWPNMILETRHRNVPMALVNGRISPKSFDRWKRRPATAEQLLDAFSVRLAQDGKNAERFSELGKQPVSMLGNLKMSATPLPVDQAALDALRAEIGDRRIWLASSTHPGEEEMIAIAHERLQSQFGDLLTIIVPRHPARGADIADKLRQLGLRCARRAAGEPPRQGLDIYIGDTLGELGLFYRLCDICLVGGSLAAKGGHNPLEPARLHAAILHGPHTYNFVETYSEMRNSGGTALVRNERDLAAALVRLFTDTMTRSAMADNAMRGAEESAEKILTDITEALEPILPARAAAPHAPA